MNAAAVDRIQENRNLWHSAGGFDPDLLATPSEIQLEEVKRVLNTLDAMLEKNGPRGGLDSFVAEIKAAAALLKVVTWEAIRTDTLGGFGLPLPHELCFATRCFAHTMMPRGPLHSDATGHVESLALAGDAHSRNLTLHAHGCVGPASFKV